LRDQVFKKVLVLLREYFCSQLSEYGAIRDHFFIISFSIVADSQAALEHAERMQAGG
jgi:hypothetical protein